MDIRANQLRKLSFKIHSISGMFLGLYILLMALAGSILVFYNEWSGFLLPSVESPAMHQNKAVTFQDLIANTEAAYSGYRVTWIKLKGYGSDFSKPILVYARSTSDSGSELGPDRKGILLNPVTGKVMGPAAPFIEAVRFFHFDLFRHLLDEIVVNTRLLKQHGDLPFCIILHFPGSRFTAPTPVS